MHWISHRCQTQPGLKISDPLHPPAWLTVRPFHTQSCHLPACPQRKASAWNTLQQVSSCTPCSLLLTSRVSFWIHSPGRFPQPLPNKLGQSKAQPSTFKKHLLNRIEIAYLICLPLSPWTPGGGQGVSTWNSVCWGPPQCPVHSTCSAHCATEGVMNAFYFPKAACRLMGNCKTMPDGLNASRRSLDMLSGEKIFPDWFTHTPPFLALFLEVCYILILRHWYCFKYQSSIYQEVLLQNPCLSH